MLAHRTIYQPFGHDSTGWFNLGDFSIHLTDAASACADERGKGNIDAFRVVATSFDEFGLPHSVCDMTDEAKDAIAEYIKARGDDLPAWLAEDNDFLRMRAAADAMKRLRAAHRIAAE